MSRGIRDLRDLICVSRLSIREPDGEISSDDDFLSSSIGSSTSRQFLHDPLVEWPDCFDSGFASHDHLDAAELSLESESIPGSNASPNQRKTTLTLSPRAMRKLRRSANGKSATEPITERSDSDGSNGIEVREGFVQSHNGDFDDLLTYIDGTVVSDWVIEADSGLQELSVWCNMEDNFIRFAHWWLTEFSSLDRVALLRLERGLLRDQVGFAFVAPQTGSSCRPGDVSTFLTAVFSEYPRRLLGVKGPQLFLDHLHVLTTKRDEEFRRLLTNVRCATCIKQHAQWTLATRSFCLVSLWAAVVNFYRQLIGDSEQNKDVGQSDGRCSVALDATTINQARIYAAIRRGYADVVHYLLSSGKVSRSLFDSQHRSLVFHAVIEKQTRVLHYLLKRIKDMDVDTPASSGNTPLHAAANAGSEDIIRELLKVKRLTVDARNTECDNATALHMAIMHGHVGLVSLLLDAGADPQLKVGEETALSLALGLGHEDVVDIIQTRIHSNLTGNQTVQIF